MAILIALFFFFGSAIEWSLATLRIWNISRGRTGEVMLIVLCEEMLMVGAGALTAYIVIKTNQLYLLPFAALGGSFGAGISMKLSKRRKK